MPTTVGYLSDLTKYAIYVFAIVLTALIAIGFWWESQQAAYIGVGLLGAIAGLPEAILNGISQLISSFFNWASHLLVILPLT